MLGKTTEYAIRALVYIYIQNSEGKRPGFKEISKMIDSPEQFTAKVLQSLTRAEIISSMKGRGGGYFFDDLSIPLKLSEVIESVEGNGFFLKCGFGLNHCDAGTPCPMHEGYSKVREGFFRFTNEQTIQSLAQKINNNEATLTRVQKVLTKKQLRWQ
ncbi:MAG: Rrf2 family transcriptional regulator [Bacteroidales bacterium]|jgi:Rrf2 family protein|nr:Rrf2 family transcriptional regulator [Bacteroidales bacterium]MDD4384642.1 Rrf2 family transcriptional regulator [Bacteroidales bacterium]MDY0197114.1 Rrf2 family transcriptional regulator [Tenuifilaceae bacterium]